MERLRRERGVGRALEDGGQGKARSSSMEGRPVGPGTEWAQERPGQTASRQHPLTPSHPCSGFWEAPSSLVPPPRPEPTREGLQSWLVKVPNFFFKIMVKCTQHKMYH